MWPDTISPLIVICTCSAIASLGLTCPVEVVNDGWNGLFAAATLGIGVNVTAGSGVNCRGRGRHGDRWDGWLAMERILASMAAQSRSFSVPGNSSTMPGSREFPPTRLTQIFLEATGAKDEMDLMEGLSNNYYHLFPYLAIQIVGGSPGGRSGRHRSLYAGSGRSWAGWRSRSPDRLKWKVRRWRSFSPGSVFEAGELLIPANAQANPRVLPEGKTGPPRRAARGGPGHPGNGTGWV